MGRTLNDLMTSRGHLVDIRPCDSTVFGATWQPVCGEDGCGYVGPHLTSLARAQAVGDEHRAKSAGTWRAA